MNRIYCGTMAGTVLLVILATLFTACPLEISLSGIGVDLPGGVERPPFDNPVDPEAEVTVMDILNGVDALGNPLVPDATLRAAILDSGGRYTNDITALNVDTTSSAVASLEGLQYFPRISSLNVSNDSGVASSITDISPLFGHPSLTHLVLAGNDLTSISLADLGEIPNLSSLEIQDTGITSLSGLENCPNLTCLDISRNPVDYSGGTNTIPALPTVEELVDQDLSSHSAPPADLAFLKDFSALRIFNLHNGAFSSLGGIESLVDLEELDIGYCSTLTDVSGIGDASGQLTHLHRINMPGVNAPLSGLNGLTSLQSLSASDRTVPIGTGLNLPNLEELSLNGASLNSSDFAAGGPLSTLTSLQYLDISDNTANSVSLAGLGSLSNLEELRASNVDIADTEDLSFVGSLNYLRYLEIDDATLSATAGITLNGIVSNSLEELHLRGFVLASNENFAFVSNLPNLWFLEVRGNDNGSDPAVLNPGNLGYATRLQEIEISGVTVTDGSSLGFVGSLPELGRMELSFFADPVNGVAHFDLTVPGVTSTQFSDLRVEGVAVSNAAGLPDTIEYLALPNCGITTGTSGGIIDEIAQNLTNVRNLDLSMNPEINTVAGLSMDGTMNQLTNLNLSITYNQWLNVAIGLSADESANGLAGLRDLPYLEEVNLDESDAARVYQTSWEYDPADPTGVYNLYHRGIYVTYGYTP